MRARQGQYRLPSDYVLLLPVLLLFLLVLVMPIGMLVASAFTSGGIGTVGIGEQFTLDNFTRLVSLDLYRSSLIASFAVATGTAVVSCILAFPVAFVLANTRSLRLATILTILVLVPFQLSAAVRIFGLIALLGDNGMINRPLLNAGIIDDPIPLMYNWLGVAVGTTQFVVPFAIFALLGPLRSIDPSLIQAGRSLGSSYWRTFRLVVIPLTKPGIYGAMLIGFALTLANYSIPNLMSAYKIQLLPSLMDQQVLVTANLRFAAALGVALVLTSLCCVVAIYLVVRRPAVARQAGEPERAPYGQGVKA